MFVREWGSTDATDVVLFLHGAEQHSGASVTEVAEILADRGIRTVAADAPGFGNSPAPIAHNDTVGIPRRYASLIRQVALIRGVSHAVLVGHSWGAHVACWAAAEVAEGVTWRSVVLLDGGYADFEAVFSRIFALEPEAALAHLYRRHAATGAPAVADAISRGVFSTPTSASWPGLTARRVPVHLLLATLPEDTRERRLAFVENFTAEVVPATVRWIDGASHEIIADSPDEVVATILAAVG